jgi:DNA helicase II / ATP-dependent DNA helicase PcrA
MARAKAKGTMIIAGPGAGKTHNMVASIIAALPDLSPCRYLAVITYTNSATNNILSRLSKKIVIPDNLFIGTMHSFLNRFIVIPFSSFISDPIRKEKLFMQCGLDDVFSHVEKTKTADKRKKRPEDIAKAKAMIRKRLNELGYITFDQTLSIAETCIANDDICKVVSNRLQFIFVDEFQDSGNLVYKIIESIRKQNTTKIYCVGDPEQYIQSFDSTIRNFANIPILKAATSTGYDVQINDSNYRSTKAIVKFLNNFNGRNFGVSKFQQKALSKNTDPIEEALTGETVYFITKYGVVRPMIDDFNRICDDLSIAVANRCIIAKRKEIIKRIVATVNNRYKDPKKTSSVLPIKAIQDTLLTTLQMNLTEFCDHYKADVNVLRKHAIAIFKAIRNGEITDENTFGVFVAGTLNLSMKAGLPVKIDNLKFDVKHEEIGGVITISTIHTIKGLESEAVLAIAKTEAELLLWIETDHAVRDLKRTNETTDYPRLGYVAFSRAERLLCISCFETVTNVTIKKLQDLGVTIYSGIT